MRSETKLHVLFLIFPCLLTVIFAIAYSLELWSWFQLIILNILCIFFIAIELIQAFIERTNIWKVCGFVGSVTISGIGVALNSHNNIKIENISLGWQSFWNWLWFGLLVISVIFLAIILIRMFQWDQERWEEIRKLRQEYRKEYWKICQERKRSRQKYKQELATERANAKIDKQKDKTEKDSMIRNEKYKQRIECIKNCRFFCKNKREKNSEETSNTETNTSEKDSKKLLSFMTIIILVVAVVLFVTIPYFEQLQVVAFGWAKAVQELAAKLNILQNNDDGYDTFFGAFASYTVSYILIIVAICLIGYICIFIYHTIMRNGKPFNYEKSLLQLYETPIAVLAVSLSFLLAIGRGEASLIEGVTNGWGYMFVAILYVLVALISVEIVRIVLEQIWQENSLLKQIIKLIFIAVLEFFAGLILGVIINFKIEDIISSLLYIVFPQEELSFTNKIQKKFNELFNKELDDNGHNDSAKLGFSIKHIWRR